MERRLAKSVIPFYGWHKFMTKFILALPVTWPGRANALYRLGELGQSETNNLGPMPEWLRATLLFDTHNLQQVHYLSMMGLNPLGDLINPAGGFQSLIAMNQLSPIMQAVIEGAGYNTLTGGLESIDPTSQIIDVNGQYINLQTGQPVGNLGSASITADFQRFMGGLLRSFPYLRIGEQYITQGKGLYPESIPFISEKEIPTAAGVPPKKVTPISVLEQLGGVAPKVYDLQHWQQNARKNYQRALSTYRNDIVKQKAQGILP
jgi:hypothetical protein